MPMANLNFIIDFNMADVYGKQFEQQVTKEIEKCIVDNTILIPNLAGVFLRTIPLLVKGLRRCMN